MKHLEFLGSSQKDLREMPADVRHALGLELMTVQFGGSPSDSNPCRTSGRGLTRFATATRPMARSGRCTSPSFADAVYVLHAFQKKTREAAKYDIDLAAKRYKMIGA